MKYRRTFLWMLGAGFIASGLYFILWAIQDASFSVPEKGEVKLYYQAIATVMYPLGLSNIGIGILFFLVSRK